MPTEGQLVKRLIIACDKKSLIPAQLLSHSKKLGHGK
jgi:hypothetical protein